MTTESTETMDGTLQPPPSKFTVRLAAKLTTAAFILYGATLAVTVALIRDAKPLADAHLAGEHVSTEAATALMERGESLDSITTIMQICLIVAFCLWVYRVVSETRRISGGSDCSPGMSVGFFFIPIANLWMPYRSLADCWNRAEPGYRNDRWLAGSGAPAPSIMLAWWLIWLAARIITPIAGVQLEGSNSPEQFSSGVVWFGVAASFEVVAIILAVMMVWKLTRRIEASSAESLPTAQII